MADEGKKVGTEQVGLREMKGRRAAFSLKLDPEARIYKLKITKPVCHSLLPIKFLMS